MTAELMFAYQGAQLRTIVVEGDPWFVAADACRMLELRDTTSAMKMVDDEDKQSFRRSDTPQFFEGMAPQVQTFTAANESGLYALIFQSNKDRARQIRRWVTHEVLPAIRKTGSYSVAPRFEIPQTLSEALRLAADEHDRAELESARADAAETKVAELEPKAEVAAKLLDAEGDLSVKDAANALTRAGIKVGQNRLFSDLERRRWISRARGDGRYRVMQAAIETGYMSVLPQSHYHPRTGVLVLDPPQPRVTPKGLQRLLADYGKGEQLSVTG